MMKTEDNIVAVAERPFEDLVALNTPVIHRTISGYADRINGMAYEDLRQEMLLVMWKCQRSFRWGGQGGQKGHDRQFFYYLQRVMYNRLRKLHQRDTRAKRAGVTVPFVVGFEGNRILDGLGPHGIDDIGGDPVGSYLDTLVDNHELLPETYCLLSSLSPVAKMYAGCRLAGIPVATKLTKHDARVARDELSSTFGRGG
jgi:DNA-directed RNA polymerase specialized sigma24 family protein